jgi:hypothetical protein
MAAFIIVGAVLLSIPGILGNIFTYIFEWSGRWESLPSAHNPLVTFLKVAIGAIIVSSMVVFCRKVLQEEDEVSSPEMAGGENEIKGELHV